MLKAVGIWGAWAVSGRNCLPVAEWPQAVNIHVKFLLRM